MSTVSILMPARNSAAYLSDCLDSIINQSYTDWEAIIVNDHSTDDTEEILKSYSYKDSRIRYFNNPGKGIIPALQKAYSECSGVYISRMDSDDLMTPDKIQLFVNQLKDKGQGHLVTAKVKYISENELGQGYLRYAAWLNDLTERNDNFSDIYKECSIPSPNWMVHIEDFKKCGGFSNEVYPEDYDLAFRFKSASLKLANINAVTHLWRDHPERASRNDDNYSDNKFTSLKVMHFLKQNYDKRKALVLWGAGAKGKAIAKELSDKGITFRWVCNNPKKIGHDIYGVILESVDIIQGLPEAQAIIAVSQKNTTESINNNVKQSQVEPFRFC